MLITRPVTATIAWDSNRENILDEKAAYNTIPVDVIFDKNTCIFLKKNNTFRNSF